jgi:hypothetical protein
LDPIAELQVVPGLIPHGGNLPQFYPSGEGLIGRTILYRDRKLWPRDRITKCFVNDVGSSELRGGFYEVIFDDKEVLVISEEEMMDILSRDIYPADELDNLTRVGTSDVDSDDI